MQKVLITGAAGFVGQHLTRSLLENYRIIGLGHKRQVPRLSENFDFLAGDILKKSFLEEVIHKYKPEVVVHLAARPITWLKNSKECFNVNLLGTLNLYEAVLKTKRKSHYDPKILYISTADVYGNTLNPKNIKETAPFFPTNHYSASKIAADRASYAYSQLEGLNIVILRPFTHTGTGQDRGFFVPDMASQIAKIETNPKKKNELFVGNLENVRDYLDVRDVVAAYKLIIKKDPPRGECFNICSGKGIKMKKILKMLLAHSKEKITVKFSPERLRAADTPVYIGNNEKFTKFTGWQPEIGIRQTLSETLNYWRKRVLGSTQT